MANPRDKAVCKHGNEVSILPSFNYVRCVKCDEEAMTHPDTPRPPMSEDGLVEVVQGNWPLSGGDGALLEPLYADPIVKANKPTGGYRKHGFDTFHLSRYDNTDLVQWFGRRSDGYFYPWGQLMRITPAGQSALVKYRAGRRDPTDKSRSPI